MRIVVHADDLGASKGVTEAIVRCVDEGPITSASVMVNGSAFGDAVAAWAQRSGLRLALHLNLVEGAPLAPPREVDLLVDDAGRFRHDFVSLWRAHALAPPRARARLAGQVRTELALQIERMRAATGGAGPIALDGHRHVHLVPFVFREVLAACDLGSVARVRVIREPLHLAPGGGGPLLAPNLAGHALLNALSSGARRLLVERGVACPDWFVGVLYTGHMSPAVVDAALRRIRERDPRDDAEVEVLFHPGGATPDEAGLWPHNWAHRAFYTSPQRARESEQLRSEAMRATLARFGAGA
jgi:hypothetical protein